MKFLGISAFYHDSAAVIVISGKIVAAAQEERFTRKKNDYRFPFLAIRYCLSAARLTIEELDAVVFYESPYEKFKRLIKTYLSFAPLGLTSFMEAMPMWVTRKLYQRRIVQKGLETFGRFRRERLHFTEHHLSHAASAFFPSPFHSASILVVDGVGESATTSVARGEGNRINICKQLHFPHSLGLLYAAFTYYLGFKINSGEYKVMGLAPYGSPIYAGLILRELVDVKADGSFRLNQLYFDYCTGLTMTNDKFGRLFGGPRRAAEALLTQKHFDLAASVQAVTDEIILRITRALAKDDDTGNLCLAGGVALNCVANGKILKDGKFRNIWIQPAAGDAGGALGAALVAHYIHNQQRRQVAPGCDGMQGSYLGPQYPQLEAEMRLLKVGGVFTVVQTSELVARVAAALVDGKVVGWFQGRMEFGPRSLGNRSILADPRVRDMQKALNLKVKARESFRPFAPAILSEDAADWFDVDCISPYMLLVAPVRERIRIPMTESEKELFGIDKLSVPRSTIPCVTHVDYSARIQTVHRETNPIFHQLLTVFKRLTGYPILVNTSFNVRGEPIVESPEQAFTCFMTTGIDVLVVGNCLLFKEKQRAAVVDKPVFLPD